MKYWNFCSSQLYKILNCMSNSEVYSMKYFQTRLKLFLVLLFLMFIFFLIVTSQFIIAHQNFKHQLVCTNSKLFINGEAVLSVSQLQY